MTEEQQTAVLARVQKRIPEESDTELLTDLIEEAETYVLSYTRRNTLPSQLETCVVKLAVIAYNRLGTEGDSARSEGGESYTFDSAPADIYSLLNLYRLVRVSGKAYEAE